MWVCYILETIVIKSSKILECITEKFFTLYGGNDRVATLSLPQQ